MKCFNQFLLARVNHEASKLMPLVPARGSSFGAFCFLAAEDGEQSFVASKVGARTEPSYESMRRGLQLTTGRIEDTGTVGSV